MQSSSRSISMRGLRMASTAAALAMLVYLPSFSAEPIVKTVRWVASDPSIPHDTYAYREITLKATSSISGKNVHAVWDFGDGTQSATFAVEKPYDVSARHIYFGAPGTLFTARVTVMDTESGESGSGTYLVAMREKSLDVEVNVAIDEGLWFLHTSLQRTGADGRLTGTWPSSANLANVEAFERSGHRESADSADPYSETLGRVLQVLRATPEGIRAVDRMRATLDKTPALDAAAATQLGLDSNLTILRSRGRDLYAAEASHGDAIDGVARTLVNRQDPGGFWTGHVSDVSIETGASLKLLSATPARQGAAITSVTNVSSQVNVTTSGFLLSKSTGLYNGTATITNTTLNPIPGPLALALHNLPGTVTLSNKTGDFNGAPYRDAGAGPLNAGQSVGVALSFTNPSKGAITFSPRVTYSGLMPPSALAAGCPANTATVGTPYTSSYVGSGGVLAYTYSTVNGSLPSQLTLNSSSGAVTGTPDTPGNVTFDAKVTDSAGGTPQTATASCSINVAAGGGDPDLTITKTHTGNFTEGSAGNTYTVTITNSGTGAKTAGQAVSVTDNPPSGLTVTAMSGTNWTCVSLPTCTRNDALAPSASYDPITVTVSVGSSVTSPKVNSITVTTAQTESNSSNNTATDSTTIVQPDLTITKTHSGDFVQGSIGNTYTVTVTNSGQGTKLAGQAVSVTDVPPTGLTVTAMSGTNWTCTTPPTCTRLTALAPGASYEPITVTVTVSATATTPRVNAITVTTAQAESNGANNTASDSTTLIRPDLTITKTHSGNFVQGSTGNTYTVTVTNSGAGAKAGGQAVSVTDLPPSGLSVTAMSGTNWTCTSLPTCTRNDVLAAAASYEPITVTVSVTAGATSPQVNAITVSTAVTESNGGNNTATDSTTINPI